LSHLQVAQFPWDPKQEPIVNPPTVPSNSYQNQGAQYINQPPSRASFSEEFVANPSPAIKPEPGLEPARITAPLSIHHSAAERAAAHLQNSYGQRAMSSISAIQANLNGQPQQQQQQHTQTQPSTQQQQQQPQTQPSMQQMHQQQQQQQMPMYQQQMQMPQMSQIPMQHMQQQQRPGPQGQGQAQGQGQTARSPMTAEAYRKAMAQQAQQQQHRLQAQSGLNGAQTDGAVDDMEECVGVIKRFNSEGGEIMGRIEIDGLIRDKIAAMGQSMEGGGLMLPLREATSAKKHQRKVKKSATALAQFDGPDSDDDKVKDEADEDAINSDLDDPDDGLNDDEEDDDSLGHIMLCMYDKVQRVKNKW
jgi:transcription initiation factor TFIIA large subunit